jgi:hypothetical protein
MHTYYIEKQSQQLMKMAEKNNQGESLRLALIDD